MAGRIDVARESSPLSEQRDGHEHELWGQAINRALNSRFTATSNVNHEQITVVDP